MQGKHRLSEKTPSTAAEDLIARLKLATDDPLMQPTDDTVLASESETDGESGVKAKKFQDVEPGVYHDDEHEDLFLLNTMPGSYSREQLGENAQPQVVCCDLAARLAARGITATTGWCIPEGEYPVGFTGQYLIGFYDEGERTIKVTSYTQCLSTFCLNHCSLSDVRTNEYIMVTAADT